MLFLSSFGHSTPKRLFTRPRSRQSSCPDHFFPRSQALLETPGPHSRLPLLGLSRADPFNLLPPSPFSISLSTSPGITIRSVPPSFESTVPSHLFLLSPQITSVDIRKRTTSTIDLSISHPTIANIIFLTTGSIRFPTFLHHYTHTTWYHSFLARTSEGIPIKRLHSGRHHAHSELDSVVGMPNILIDVVQYHCNQHYYS